MESDELPPWVKRCSRCRSTLERSEHCSSCRGLGYTGVRLGACSWAWGTTYRLLVMQARLLARRPLIHSGDSRDYSVVNTLNRGGAEHWLPHEVHDPGVVETDE